MLERALQNDFSTKNLHRIRKYWIFAHICRSKDFLFKMALLPQWFLFCWFLFFLTMIHIFLSQWFLCFSHNDFSFSLTMISLFLSQWFLFFSHNYFSFSLTMISLFLSQLFPFSNVQIPTHAHPVFFRSQSDNGLNKKYSVHAFPTVISIF